MRKNIEANLQLPENCFEEKDIQTIHQMPKDYISRHIPCTPSRNILSRWTHKTLEQWDMTKILHKTDMCVETLAFVFSDGTTAPPSGQVFTHTLVLPKDEEIGKMVFNCNTFLDGLEVYDREDNIIGEIDAKGDCKKNVRKEMTFADGEKICGARFLFADPKWQDQEIEGAQPFLMGRPLLVDIHFLCYKKPKEFKPLKQVHPIRVKHKECSSSDKDIDCPFHKHKHESK